MQEIDFHKYFYYDETSPSFLRWKINRMAGYNHMTLHIREGKPAGNYNAKDPYCVVSLDYTKYSVHRIIWILFGGEIPEGYKIDHLDQNTRNNNICNLRCIPFSMNSRNCSMAAHNTSGITGVSRKNDAKYPLWRATWMDITGKKREKNFAVLKHGEEAAFKLACEYREKMILELNLMGQGYTEHHGITKKPVR